MKRASASLANFLAAAVGLDGVFLLVAVVTLSVGSWFVSTILPWFVIGTLALIVWLALVTPRQGR